MKHLLLLSVLLHGSLACFTTNQRPAQFAAQTQQFQQAPVPPQQFAGGQQIFPAARVAAAGRAPTSAIAARGSALESLLGRQVSLTEFGADGYNAEAGGPVNSGSALTCNFDGRPCCWANVASPDDQLDWQIANGAPDTNTFRDAPSPQGSYLVAYARAAAPSDEAQFASCSIGCSSSPITVRVKHWKTEAVLLQVCLRDSFPNNVEHNPLLNCQEFPSVHGLATTEVVLPRSSLVDIVFVASSFVSENGDMAILDDIEVSYDHSGPECQAQEEEQELQGAAHRQTLESSNQKTAVLEKKQQKVKAINEELESLRLKEKNNGAGGVSEGQLKAASERFGEGGFRGGESAFGNHKAAGPTGTAIGKEGEVHVIESVKTPKTHGQPLAKGAKTKKFSESICQSTKCDFEGGNTCNYKDAHQTQSIRGLTTRFQVAEGQFMNRVTGVKESSEGDYYAATFLFPREMAGLEAETEPFTEKTRLRFRYYEGTHGVQLKGCCGSIETCPFSSDKFVSVSDRTWKTASFKCPKGTDKVIFLCENTRTNQGACAVDDIGMVESDGSLTVVRPLC